MPTYTTDGDLIRLLSFLKKEKKADQKRPTYQFAYPRNTAPRSTNPAYLK